MNNFMKQLLIQSISNVIAMIFALLIGIFIMGYIEKITIMFDTINQTLSQVESIIEIDSTAIIDKATTLSDSAGIVTDGLDKSGTSLINNLQKAWND